MVSEARSKYNSSADCPLADCICWCALHESGLVAHQTLRLLLPQAKRTVGDHNASIIRVQTC